LDVDLPVSDSAEAGPRTSHVFDRGVPVLLAELADRIGLAAALSEATDGLRWRRSGTLR
jgi:hypothetical protein